MQPSSGQHQIVPQKAAGSCPKVAISAKDSCSLSSQQIALKQPSDGPQNCTDSEVFQTWCCPQTPDVLEHARPPVLLTMMVAAIGTRTLLEKMRG